MRPRKRKLYTFRMAEATSITDLINSLKTLFSLLTTFGHKIEEFEHAELQFESFPDSYDQFIINLMSNILTKYLVAFVLEEESRRKNKAER